MILQLEEVQRKRSVRSLEFYLLVCFWSFLQFLLALLFLQLKELKAERKKREEKSGLANLEEELLSKKKVMKFCYALLGLYHNTIVGLQNLL